MDMSQYLADGETFIEGRSSGKAKELLARAEELGLDSSAVRTTSRGYIVSKQLVEDEPDNPDVDEVFDADGDSEDSDGFDPSEHNVAEVQEYLESADDTERERVLALEQDGKARRSLLPVKEGE